MDFGFMSSTLLKNIVGSSIYPNRGWVSLEGIDWRMKFKWFNGRSVSIEICGIVVGVVKEITIEKQDGFFGGAPYSRWPEFRLQKSKNSGNCSLV